MGSRCSYNNHKLDKNKKPDIWRQAGAELGQAQLTLELNYTSILHWIDDYEVLSTNTYNWTWYTCPGGVGLFYAMPFHANLRQRKSD